jgi:NTP pyrophosphatase (non-canonical NTP hydrolase)
MLREPLNCATGSQGIVPSWDTPIGTEGGQSPSAVAQTGFLALGRDDGKRPVNLAFATLELRTLCESQSQAERRYGYKVAKKLRERLADLREAATVLQLPAGRPREVPAGRYTHYIIHLAGGYRLVLGMVNAARRLVEAEAAMKAKWQDRSRAVYERFLKLAQCKGKLTSENEVMEFLALAICGEAGELANLIKKQWRGDEVNRQEIVDELADIRIYLEHMARHLGVNLDKACESKVRVVAERVSARERDAAGRNGS